MATSKRTPLSARFKPLHGGPFGTSGRYAIATMPCIDRGLHAVRHMIVEPRAGAVLSVSLDKREALASARRLLRAAESLARQERTARALECTQDSLFPADILPPLAYAGAPPQKRIGRRRREVFERSQGRCHYCRTPIAIDGFHIEHMLPQALGGSDDLLNLVAACPTCNLSKGDQTAIEYVAKNSTSKDKS